MPTMIESLAQTRHAERYLPDHRAARDRGVSGRLRSTRTRAGWLLVGLGLRMVLSGRHDAAQRITLI